MDAFENTYTPQKRSPYADSPYECAYTEPQIPVQPEKPRKKNGRRGVGPALTAILLIVCCTGTALAVTGVWQNRMDRMEAAVQDKFAALEQLYKESGRQESIQQPDKNPMTPGEVYAKNVAAVVAVNTRRETQQGYSEGAGSGFIISADGYVVTNYHVVDDATTVSVLTHGGETLIAQVVGFDDTADVALLKVGGENHPFVTLGSSDKLIVGDQVVAIGNPLGELTSTLTVGFISAKDRIVDTDGTVINMLQTDAAINSGKSGGPLFNMNGEVVGITTAKYSGNSGSGATIEGLGFAIPMDDVEMIVSDLKEYGYVTGAYMGVYVRDVDSSAQSYGLPAGAYVEDVTKGFAAEKAGIRAGDIIVNLGGYDVDSVTTLTRVLRRLDAGQTTSVTVYRSGQKVYLTITLDEKPVETEQNNSGTPNENQNGFDNWFDFLPPFFGND